MMYADAFRYANEHLPGKNVVICNSDIWLSDDFNKLSPQVFDSKMVLALSRWDDEECQGPTRDRSHCDAATYLGSHDSFIFRAPIPVDYSAIDFPTNAIGAENVVMWELARSGTALQNPCLALRTFHVDCHRTAPGPTSSRINWGRTDVANWPCRVVTLTGVVLLCVSIYASSRRRYARMTVLLCVVLCVWMVMRWSCPGVAPRSCMVPPTNRTDDLLTHSKCTPFF
jgi:hypothetical protein